MLMHVSHNGLLHETPIDPQTSAAAMIIVVINTSLMAIYSTQHASTDRLTAP